LNQGIRSALSLIPGGKGLAAKSRMKNYFRIVKARYIVVAFCVGMAMMALCLGPGLAAAAGPSQVKELNFVFLHGRGGTNADMQLLADTLEEQARPYISAFVQANPGTIVKINALQRSYPNDVNIETWANSIVDSIENHFAGKRNLILVGHSMGGKAALYGVIHNSRLGSLTDLVVTINTPVKDLNSYYIFGGGSITDYIREARVISDRGVVESLASYDCSAEGYQVGTAKHWLALVSSESAPSSPQFDTMGVDPFPRDMDDGAVPISAQYSEGADAVYYGEHGHGDFSDQPVVAGIIADRILQYLFGGIIETPVLLYSQTFDCHAGWLPVTYHWDTRLGEFPGPSGIISHQNNSFLQWQEWGDVVGVGTPGFLPSAYTVEMASPPVLTGVSQVNWLNPGDPADYRLSIKTRAGFNSQVQARWKIIQYPSLPPGINHSHYEIRVTGGTTLTDIPHASWSSGAAAETRVQVQSQAKGPFRWFKAEVKVYRQLPVWRKLIDGIASQAIIPD
jgi:pimeloyl-ACP methyl ester carboxylesterase